MTALITVPAMMRAMGLEADASLATSIGAEVRERYRKRTGQPPLKALTPKGGAPGSNCHAVYPEEFLPDIVGIIRARQAMRAAQLDLFIEDDQEAR